MNLSEIKSKLHISKNRKLIVAAAAVVIAVVAIAFAIFAGNGGAEETYTTAKAEAVTMEQTLTAAGEIKAAASEDIEFSTSKTFRGMCVEEGDAVAEGQHLIKYSNGTYTDAPAAGIITKISAPDTGDAADDDNYLTIAYTDNMVLQISVPEDDISKVKKGDEAEIIVNADTSKTYTGKISSVKAMSSDLLSSAEESEETDETEGSSADADSAGNNERSYRQEASSTATYYTVKILVANDDTLKPGMSANCTITVSSRKSVLAVPVEAVRFDGEEQAYVNLAEGNEVTKKKVTTGESDAFYVEITEGLTSGDMVQIQKQEQTEK